MAWYRCEFSLPETLKGKSVFLHFGGIAGNLHIFVNNKWVEPQKTLPNGVQARDITAKVRFDKKNTIVVQIHNPTGSDGIIKMSR